MCIQMSAAGYGDMEYFMNLPVEEFVVVVNEIGRVVKEHRKKKKTAY